MMRWSVSAAGLAGLALTAACTGGGATRVTDVSAPRASAYELRASLAAGTALVILGTPPDGAPAEAVAAVLHVPARYGGGPFRLERPGTRTDRVVIAFGHATPAALCTDQGGQERPPTLVASAAYCQGTTVRASARMTDDSARGPGDPAFRQAFALLLAEMLNDRVVGGAPR